MLNVLRGEMSLVGPRPLPLRDYALLEDWHRKRYHVLPGMTGLWQISGRSDLSFDDLVRLDFYYLENWSIWLDISILAKTLPARARKPRRVLSIRPVLRRGVRRRSPRATSGGGRPTRRSSSSGWREQARARARARRWSTSAPAPGS